ncbi:hypothetical protein [Streptomyces sp. NPDC058613]|uniref:hypothetical protein n=1 Tax=Streptomyces sp. NPDC058613 TaxID=3346556 RepID=UPI00364FD7DF
MVAENVCDDGSGRGSCGEPGDQMLEAVHAPDAPSWLRELPAVQVLRTMWVQNYHRTVSEAGAEVKRRESKGLPPGRLRLASPYDTDARYGLKQDSWWTGYKIHISESCDEPTCRTRPPDRR